MLFTLFFSLAVLVFTPLTLAQSQNPILIAGLLRAFQAANLTSLGNASFQINSTTTGQNLFAQLSSGNNFTIFAPSNAAFQNVSANVTGDSNTLANVLAYHVVIGSFANHTTFFPNDTIGRTLLNNSTLVNLEGNKSQVLAWTNRADNKTHVLNQPTDVVVTNTTSFNNIQINVIDAVLNIPANLSTSIGNITCLSDFQLIGDIVTVPSTNTTTNQTTNITVLEFLDMAKGLTLFAPDNKAFISPTFTASQLIENDTAIFNVIRNLFVNGTTVYSPSLASANLTTAAGENLTFTTNSSGTFVNSTGMTARIVQPDVLLSNGVVHVIDNVLINTQTNESVASSAFASATSAASVSTTETGPIGVPTSVVVRRNNAVTEDASSDASVLLFGLLLGAMFVVF